MRFRLIPRETKFFQLFNQVSANLTRGARLLHEILQESRVDEAKIRQLQEIEHLGDEMTHNIIIHLNQTFITPFDREDIYRLTSSLDDVLDFVNSAGVRLVIEYISLFCGTVGSGGGSRAADRATK